MKTQSIQKRLIFAVVISQALLAIGLTCAGVLYTRRRVLASLEESLQAHAMSVAAVVRFPEDGGKRLIFDRNLVPGPVDGAHSDLYQVSTAPLGIIGQSAYWPQGFEPPCATPNRFANMTWAGTPYRVICLTNVPVLDREEDQPIYTLNVFYAAPSWQVRKEERAAAFYIAIASFILMSGTTLLALWGIRRGLLPLQHLADQASAVTANRWEFRTPPEAELTEELRPLTVAMESMLRRLESSFSQQREFLGNAAHELKTPVAILKSTLQGLVQKSRSSAEYQTGIRRALEDMDRLEKLLRGMLRLARAEQWSHGTSKPELSPVDVGLTCEGAIVSLGRLAQMNQNELQLTTDRDLVVQADPEDLETVWVNLLENAIHYSPAGSPVRIQVRRNGHEQVKVIVEDQGAGIAPDQLDRIFERFHRGDASRARETGGFGLGLAIAKALIEAHGGTIRAESDSGRGTRMIVELPLVQN